jgi:hypothetical protein
MHPDDCKTPRTNVEELKNSKSVGVAAPVRIQVQECSAVWKKKIGPIICGSFTILSS